MGVKDLCVPKVLLGLNCRGRIVVRYRGCGRGRFGGGVMTDLGDLWVHLVFILILGLIMLYEGF